MKVNELEKDERDKKLIQQIGHFDPQQERRRL